MAALKEKRGRHSQKTFGYHQTPAVAANKQLPAKALTLQENPQVVVALTDGLLDGLWHDLGSLSLSLRCVQES